MDVLSTWFDRLSPWASLLASVWSAVSMDRDEDNSPWIVGFAALGFALLSVTTLAHRRTAAAARETPSHLHRLLRFTTMTGSQSLVQGALLFSAPFYIQAAAYTVGQCIFLTVFAACVFLSLWDPWMERCLLHPLFGPVLLAFSSFAAWNVALPMLGVSHGRALWIAAGAVSVGIPLLMYVADREHVQPRGFLLGVAVLPLLLAAFGAVLLPAAPLKVVEIGIGTQVVDRTLHGARRQMDAAPATLFCLSAIFEPRALDEGLVHIWKHDGEELFRIPLAVHGGRKRGFRTWSRLPLGTRARGIYRCEVATNRGQTLAVTDVRIGPPS